MTAAKTTDYTSLVELAQAGNKEAMAELVRCSQQKLLGFLVKLTRNPALAQDIAQETYIKVIEKIGTLSDADRFESWLMRMARNLFIDHVRSRKNQAHASLDNVAELEDEQSSCDIKIEAREALRNLSEADRTAMIMVYCGGADYKELAKEMGTTATSLRTRVHRARHRVQEEQESELAQVA